MADTVNGLLREAAAHPDPESRHEAEVLLAHALGLRRIAARLLLDHAFEHARHERHARGLDRLQVDGREEPRSRRIARRLVAVGKQVRRRADARESLRGANGR